MAIDIIEEVRKCIGSKPVPKIDPNIQAPNETFSSTFKSVIGKAVTPAVLVGFYKKTRNENEAADLMKENTDATLEYLFGNKKSHIITSVANYAGVSEAHAENEMKNTISAVKNVLAQENKILDGKS